MHLGQTGLVQRPQRYFLHVMVNTVFLHATQCGITCLEINPSCEKELQELVVDESFEFRETVKRATKGSQ